MMLRADELKYQQDGDKLVLVGQLTCDQIDPLDIAVLSHYQVSHMLPVSIRQQDQTYLIDYVIGRRKPLSEWLRLHKVTEERCLQFLLHVVNHLGQLRDGLFLENRCLLSPQMIFVDVQLLDARFVYWPDRAKEADEQEVAYHLQQLCIQLAKYRSDMESLRTIMRYLDDPLFSLRHMRRQIIGLLDHQSSSVPIQQPSERQAGREHNKHRLSRWMSFMRRSQRKEAVSTKLQQPQQRSRYTIPLSQLGDPVKGMKLAIQTEDGRREELSIHRLPFILGRDPQVADWVHDDVKVSRMHAEIKTSPEGFMIRDLGSHNGTLVNGERLIPYTDKLLRLHDQIELADLRCTLHVTELPDRGEEGMNMIARSAHRDESMV